MVPKNTLRQLQIKAQRRILNRLMDKVGDISNKELKQELDKLKQLKKIKENR